MHRYIPVIAAHEGFDKINEKVVQHQARKYGKTKFGADRFLNGFLDLITLWFINGFGKRPMHFFGFWGTLMLLVGFGFTLYLGIDKLYFNTQSRLITQRPEFLYCFDHNDFGCSILYRWIFRRNIDPPQ